MTTETSITKIPHETFALFRASVRAHSPYDLTKAAGIEWPVSASRMMYLAYGFIRGKAYRTMEPTARPLFDRMGHAETAFLKGLAQLITFGGVPTTPEELKGWMSLPEPEAHAAKRVRHERAAHDARTARRAAFSVGIQTIPAVA